MGSEWQSWGWMATDPTIYNSGVTGVSLPAADSPDGDNRPFYDPDSLSPPRSAHLTLLFFASTGSSCTASPLPAHLRFTTLNPPPSWAVKYSSNAGTKNYCRLNRTAWVSLCCSDKRCKVSLPLKAISCDFHSLVLPPCFKTCQSSHLVFLKQLWCNLGPLF